MSKASSHHPGLYRALVIGELMLDTTVRVQVPTKARSLLRRSEPLVYEQKWDEEETTTLGGLIYIGRFLQHFSEVDLVFPIRNEGKYGHAYRRLTKQLDKRNLKVHAVEASGACYNATRYLESADSLTSGRPDFLERRGILRIDSGTIGKLSAGDADRFLRELKRVLVGWPPPNRDACIVLADYDLGVFTKHLLDDIRRILPTGIPVVIYAGRTWRQYQDWQDATIVADTNEAIADLMMMEGMEDELAVEDAPFPHIAARHPSLGAMVLVNRLGTRAGEWKFDPNKGLVTGQVVDLKLEQPYARTPIGHRAIVVACLALARMRELPLSSWPRIAHYASEDNNDKVLIGDIDQERVNRVSGLFEGASIPRDFPKSEVAELRCEASDLLRSQILERGGYFPFELSHTGVPEVLTTHREFREQLISVIRQIEKNALSSCAADASEGVVLQKLFMNGDSGTGKSFIARQLAKKVAGNEDSSILNLIDDVVPKRPEEVVEVIRGLLFGGRFRAVVLDEIDKYQKGRSLHELLLKLFDDCEQKPAPKWRRVLVIAACSRETRLLGANDKKNHKDFYTRFPTRIEVPPVVDRPLDAVHVFASVLQKAGVLEVSLAGLCAIAEKGFSDLRKVRSLAGEVSATQKKGRIEASQFLSANIKVQIARHRDRFATLQPLI